jgi:hypothetical protein
MNHNKSRALRMQQAPILAKIPRNKSSAANQKPRVSSTLSNLLHLRRVNVTRAWFKFYKHLLTLTLNYYNHYCLKRPVTNGCCFSWSALHLSFGFFYNIFSSKSCNLWLIFLSVFFSAIFALMSSSSTAFWILSRPWLASKGSSLNARMNRQRPNAQISALRPL